MILRTLFAVALLAMASLGIAVETETRPATTSCSSAYAALPHGTILDLLDPDAPAQKRGAALSAYQQLATMRECPEFAYTLGQMYRHGNGLPGNPLPQDVSKARELLRPMAESGYLPAFADLAEMEMRHGNAREAMRWTQIYLHFVQTVKMDGTHTPEYANYQRAAYNGNLLARTDAIWRHLLRPRLPRSTIREDLNAYLGERGASVTQLMREREQGLHRRISAQDGGPTRIIAAPSDCSVRLPGNLGAAAASWIVEVMPDGRTGRIVLENFVPVPQVAEAMKECLMQRRFAPFDGSESTTIRMSMVVGSPAGASMQRRRKR